MIKEILYVIHAIIFVPVFILIDIWFKWKEYHEFIKNYWRTRKCSKD